MKYAYINGVILDGSENMEPKKDMIVLTEGEKITGIVSKDADISGYEKIDLAGQYIMPGLVNMHVHIPASGKPKKKPTDNVKLVRLMTSNALMRALLASMCKKYAKTELMSGVTTLRAVGGIQNFDSVTRDLINEGKADGPRILAANMAVSVPGGHMAGSLAYIANSPEEAKEFVKKIAEDKPDLIKLMITGGVLDARVKGEPSVLKMPAEYVKAACDEAHKLGFKVAAHVESPEGVKVALANGVDTIEHGAKPDDEMIALFKQHGACQIATISPALPYALFDPAVSHTTEMEQFNGDVVFRGIVDCAKACLENGIPVGLGTDTGCPFTTHYDMWREVNYFVKYCDVTPSFALYTATKLNAELGGVGDVTGSIEVGKCADMIVTKGDPLKDVKALRDLSMVVARGKVFREPRVKKMPEVETELDKFL